MSFSRLSLALDEHLVAVPDGARVVVFRPRADFDLSMLSAPVVVQSFFPDAEAFRAQGIEVVMAPEGRFDAAVVCMPRVKAEARALVAEAARITDGPIIVDGQKLDGIDSLLKDIRKRVEVGGVISKAHGKIFAFQGGDFTDWADPGPQQVDGYQTRIGVFSADGPDRASVLLADALPPLQGAVADLGAGWGYLSARVLAASPAVTVCHLIEAEARALDCARANVPDPRAQFHWADATSFRLPDKVHHVVMNPPFHNTRTPDPGLGRAFIASAAGVLTPRGTLWLVANRHLPYEPVLDAFFGEVAEIAGDASFKILRADRPRRG